MREDMAKIIVERPRRGGGGLTPKNLSRDLPLDEWHSKEGMRRQWRGWRKGLNENLAPLRRFLRSRVGRKWDDVYSEIRERVNMNSAVQYHIWQHVMQYVCVNTIEYKGRSLESRGIQIRHKFYVDAVNGVLRENPARRPRWRHEAEQDPDVIRIDDWNQYRRINGVWYRVHLKPLPDSLYFAWDVVFKKMCIHIPFDTLNAHYGWRRYASGKKQLNTKEIIALKREYCVQ